MAESTTQISLDVQKTSVPVFVAIKQGDTGSRKIGITLSDGGFPFEIGRGCYAVLNAVKPDGNILYNHCDLEGNTIVYTVTEQTSAAAGRMSCEIRLYGPEDTLITSATFFLVVDGTIYTEEKVESRDEVSALTHLVSEAATVIADGKETNEQGQQTIQTAQQVISEAEGASDAANQAAGNAETAAKDAGTAAQAANDASQKAETATANANAATGNANSAATSANNAGAAASNAAGRANDAADSADAAAREAAEAAGRAGDAETGANQAADNANTAAGAASQAAGNANTAAAKAGEAAGKANAAAGTANSAAEETLAAKDAFLEAANTAMEELRGAATNGVDAPAIVCSAQGEAVVLKDAAVRLFRGLKVFGKTTQDGIPSPEAPVELVSVGNGGSMEVTVWGKNLFRTPPGGQSKGVDFQVREDGSVHISGTPSGTYALIQQLVEIGRTGILPDKTYTLCGYGLTDNTEVAVNAMQGDTVSLASYNGRMGAPVTFRIPEGTTHIRFAVQTINQLDAVNTVVCPVLSIGDTAAAFEPYKEAQTLPVSTPNGLPGIPVTSGGNYTDETGQQWVCDEVDFEKGVYVQRINTKQASAMLWAVNTGWTNLHETAVMAYARISDIRSGTCLSNKYVNRAFTQAVSHWVVGEMATEKDGILYAAIPKSAGETANDVVAYMAAQNVRIMYQLITPIETDLTAEELARYAALHTNCPNTTILNDAGAHMEVNYAADTKLYIDNKFKELAAALVNNV